MAKSGFLVPLPPSLEKQLAEAEQSARVLLAGRDVEGAFAQFLTVYEAMLSEQPPGKRFHKGLPLNQMGIFMAAQGRLRDTARFFLNAFIEDSLSRGEEFPQGLDELDRPAALNLIRVLGFAPTDLIRWARDVRGFQAAEGLVQDPELLHHELRLDATLSGIPEETRSHPEEPPGEPPTVPPGEPPSGPPPSEPPTVPPWGPPPSEPPAVPPVELPQVLDSRYIDERRVPIPMVTLTEQELHLLAELIGRACKPDDRFLRAEVMVPDGELMARNYPNADLADVLRDTPRDRIRSLEFDATTPAGTRLQLPLPFETNRRASMLVQGPRDDMILLKARVKDFLDLQTSPPAVQLITSRPGVLIASFSLALVLLLASLLLAERLDRPLWQLWPVPTLVASALVAIAVDRSYIAGMLVPRVLVPGWGRYGWLRTSVRWFAVVGLTALIYLVLELVVLPGPPPVSPVIAIALRAPDRVIGRYGDPRRLDPVSH